MGTENVTGTANTPDHFLDGIIFNFLTCNVLLTPGEGVVRLPGLADPGELLCICSNALT